ASVAGLVGAPTQSAYAASKHAVVGMTKTAAAEYGREGIRINSVCPGAIKTPMLARALEREPQREKKLRGLHPLGRVGESAEVANAALWLCSEQASFVNGHQLAVDGGLTAI
ncbi:MAG: SDR family oxidoreductase, partial [Massilia sp.]